MIEASPAGRITDAVARVGDKATELAGKAKRAVENTAQGTRRLLASKPKPTAGARGDIYLPLEPHGGRKTVSERDIDPKLLKTKKGTPARESEVNGVFERDQRGGQPFYGDAPKTTPQGTVRGTAPKMTTRPMEKRLKKISVNPTDNGGFVVSHHYHPANGRGTPKTERHAFTSYDAVHAHLEKMGAPEQES